MTRTSTAGFVSLRLDDRNCVRARSGCFAAQCRRPHRFVLSSADSPTNRPFFLRTLKGHKEKCNLSCQICPRSYHLKCINNNPPYAQLDSFALLNDKSTFIKDDWVCFECEIIARAESDEGKSACMRRINKDQFNELLDYALVMIKKSADVSLSDEYGQSNDALLPA